MKYAIAVHGVAGQGMISPAVFIKSFDHEAKGGSGDGELTTNVAEAMTFDSPEQAYELWRKTSTTAPIRPDGKPNRPMTMFTVSVEPVDQATNNNNDVVGLAILTAITSEEAKASDKAFSIESDGEEITWNVTKMMRDAKAGRFGPLCWAPMNLIPPSNWDSGNLSRDKVDQIKADRAELDVPAIAVEAPDGSGMLRCFVDGNHHVTARQELGLPTVFYYTVPADMEREYRILTEVKQ